MVAIRLVNQNHRLIDHWAGQSQRRPGGARAAAVDRPGDDMFADGELRPDRLAVDAGADQRVGVIAPGRIGQAAVRPG